MRQHSSGAHIHEIRRRLGRWSFLLSAKVSEAKRERNALNALADAGESGILDQVVSHDLAIADVVKALAPGGAGIDSLKPKAGAVRLREACDSLLAEVAVSPKNTQRIATVITRQLLVGFGDVEVASIGFEAAQRWLRNKRWGVETQKQKKSYASRVWEIAIRIERDRARVAKEMPKLVENPWDAIKMPREKAKEAKFLNVRETHALLDELETQRRLRASAFLACGFLGTMRIGEACALRWHSIDFHLKEIEIVPFRASRLKSKNSMRVVHAPERLMVALARWKMKAPSGAYVFGGTDPLPERTGERWARKALDSVGLTELTFHSGRHSAISNALSAGISVPEVVRQAGVSAKTLLSTYAHVVEEKRDRIAKAYELPEILPDEIEGEWKKASS